jgi:hypothetical protein
MAALTLTEMVGKIQQMLSQMMAPKWQIQMEMVGEITNKGTNQTNVLTIME